MNEDERRELKAADVNSKLEKRARYKIDHNAGNPVEPPSGFYDASGEERPPELPRLEGKRRIDIEAQLRRHDIAKNNTAQKQDAPSAIM